MPTPAMSKLMPNSPCAWAYASTVPENCNRVPGMGSSRAASAAFAALAKDAMSLPATLATTVCTRSLRTFMEHLVASRSLIDVGDLLQRYEQPPGLRNGRSRTAAMPLQLSGGVANVVGI
jgi:hypothetical protein